MGHAEADFLARIIANPRCITSRLVYADWLDENASTAPCKRCGGGKVWVSAWEEEDCFVCGASGRVPDCRAVRADFIRNCPPLMHRRVRPGRWEWTHDRRSGDANEYGGDFCWAGMPVKYHAEAMKLVSLPYKARLHWYKVRHGFVDEIKTSFEAWAAWGRGLVRKFPIARVNFALRPGIFTATDRDGVSTAWFDGMTPQVVPELVTGGHMDGVIARTVVADYLCKQYWPGIEFDMGKTPP